MNSPKPNRLVLLVEDSDDDAFFFERAFESASAGCELIRVTDGGAALDYLQRTWTAGDGLSGRHVVFLDLKLPVFNGFDVLRWVREHDPAVEVVILSGSDLESDRDMARQLGASDYLVKPISAQALRKLLTREEVAD